MQHLEKYQDKYRFRTPGENGLTIEVEIDYWKGKGIMLAVRPVTIKDGMLQWVMGAGCNVLAMSLPRKSDKTLLEVAERLDGIAPDLARLWHGVPNSIASGEAGRKATAAIIGMMASRLTETTSAATA